MAQVLPYLMVYGATNNAIDNYAGRFINTSTGITGINYGIRAECAGATNWAGFFDGRAGNSGGTFTTSDSILKTNIQPLKSAMSLLAQLKPMEYNFDLAKYAHLGLSGGLHYGFLAQDYANVFPQFVANANYPGEVDAQGKVIHDPMDFKMINREELIPILVAAIQELNQRVDACGCAGQRQGLNNNSNPQNTTEISLANSQIIYLDQNAPNPFETETTINYNIPENINAAKIIFFNNNGNVLKEVDIKHKGAGSIKVYATELTAGTYNYSLVADGKIIDTKKMVKSVR